MSTAYGESMTQFSALFNNLHRPRSFPHTDEETHQIEAEEKRLRNAIIDEFTRSRGLTRARGGQDWWRILGMKPLPNLPEDDHGELYCHGGKPVMYVCHVYGPIGDKRLRAMTDAAINHRLQFTVDGWSWYFPGATLRVIWMPLHDIRAHFKERQPT